VNLVLHYLFIFPVKATGKMMTEDLINGVLIEEEGSEVKMRGTTEVSAEEGALVVTGGEEADMAPTGMRGDLTVTGGEGEEMAPTGLREALAVTGGEGADMAATTGMTIVVVECLAVVIVTSLRWSSLHEGEVRMPPPQDTTVMMTNN